MWRWLSLNPCPGALHSQSTLTQVARARKVRAPKDSCSHAPGMWVQQEGLLLLSSASTQSWTKEEFPLQGSLWELEWKALHLRAMYRVLMQSLLCAHLFPIPVWGHRWWQSSTSKIQVRRGQICHIHSSRYHAHCICRRKEDRREKRCKGSRQASNRWDMMHRSPVLCEDQAHLLQILARVHCIQIAFSPRDKGLEMMSRAEDPVCVILYIIFNFLCPCPAKHHHLYPRLTPLLRFIYASAPKKSLDGHSLSDKISMYAK